MKLLTKETWDAVLAYCKSLDIELGETPDFMYSVRTKTGVLTIWTKDGWRDGWYQARIIPIARKEKLYLKIELGSPPKDKAWTKEAIEKHLLDIIQMETVENESQG